MVPWRTRATTSSQGRAVSIAASRGYLLAPAAVCGHASATLGTPAQAKQTEPASRAATRRWGGGAFTGCRRPCRLPRCHSAQLSAAQPMHCKRSARPTRRIRADREPCAVRAVAQSPGAAARSSARPALCCGMAHLPANRRHVGGDERRPQLAVREAERVVEPLVPKPRRPACRVSDPEQSRRRPAAHTTAPLVHPIIQSSTAPLVHPIIHTVPSSTRPLGSARAHTDHRASGRALCLWAAARSSNGPLVALAATYSAELS